MIELLLIQDVKFLGKRGEKVRVKKGYARNYLLPLSKAIPATASNAKMVEKVRVQWLAEEAKLIEELRELAAHIGKLDLKIVAKASDAGQLYGSVAERDIAQAASKAGVAFDAKHVRIDHSLKQVGDYEVLIHLHEKVEVTIPVRVRAEGREDWIPGQEEESAVSEPPEAPPTGE